jgi:hypothetical protein
MIKSNLTLTPNLPFLYALLKYNYDPSAHLLKQLRITWGSSYEYKRVSFDERPSVLLHPPENLVQILIKQSATQL